jgi:hypothetical protein
MARLNVSPVLALSQGSQERGYELHGLNYSMG